MTIIRSHVLLYFYQQFKYAQSKVYFVLLSLVGDSVLDLHIHFLYLCINILTYRLCIKHLHIHYCHFSLNETIESFETRCEELQAKLEQQKRELKSSRKDKEYNRTWSVPSLVDGGVEYKGLTRGSYDYLGFPSMNQCWNQKKEESNSREIKDLRETVRTLKMQYFAEQKRRMDIEADLNNSLGENKNLLVKIKDFEEVISKKEELKIEKSAAMAEASQHPVKCAKCSSRAASVAGSDIGDSDFIEHDLDDLPRKQVVRLKCGGSAFGSRESLNQIGLEAVTPTLESCSDVLALAVVQRNVDTPEEDVDEEEDDNTMKAPDPDSTLLGELEEQYRKLVKKYERLVETKSQREHKSKESSAQSSQSSINTLNGTEDVVRRRPKTLTISKEVQTAWRKSSCLDFTSPADPTEGHFQKGPPEYKKLFKEIFDTLQKAAGDDVDQLNTSTSSTS